MFIDVHKVSVCATLGATLVATLVTMTIIGEHCFHDHDEITIVDDKHDKVYSLHDKFA